jgi:hypothetical protein
VIRLLLVLLCLLALAAALAAMRAGWRHRGERQADVAPLCDVPDDLGTPLITAATGLYVGTTRDGSWQDRIVAQGFGRRAGAVASVYAAGVLIDRQGDLPVFLPADDLRAARLEPALAGKVIGRGGLLVIRWQHGGTLLDTAFRADDKSTYPAWVRAINERVASA